MGSIRGEGGAGGGGGGGGLADLVDDTTPQLGGNLDVNGHNVGGVTPTELGYLSGVSSSIQTQLGAKAPTNSPALTGTPTAPTAAADTNTTQIATTAFVLGQISAAVSGLLDLRGDLDASANPNYPAGSKGDTYYVTVAGKVGGASGKSVDVGDAVVCKTDNAGGTEASVGTSWFVVEHNLAGALLSANNLSDVANAATALANLGGVGAASPVLTGTVVVRQTAGVAGTDEIQLSHDGAKSIFRSKDGGVIFYDGPTNSFDWGVTTPGTLKINGNIAYGGTLLSDNFAGYSSGAFVKTAGVFGWCSGTPGLTGTTTAIGQPSTGVVEINNGTLGQYRDFKARVIESTQTTGTAPLTVASTTVVTNLNADKLDGKDAVDFAPCTQATLTAAASVALDFAAAGLATLTTNQNTTFTTSNRAAGRQPYNLRIIGGGAHTLTFPAGWKWLNSTMPAAIASGKTGRLCLECYGSADTDVVASFAVEA